MISKFFKKRKPVNAILVTEDKVKREDLKEDKKEEKSFKDSVIDVTGKNFKIKSMSPENKKNKKEEVSIDDKFIDYENFEFLTSRFNVDYVYNNFYGIDLAKKYKSKINFYKDTELYLKFKFKTDKYTRNEFLLFEITKFYINAMQCLTKYYIDKKKSFNKIIFDLAKESILNKYKYIENEYHFKNLFQFELAQLFNIIFDFVKNIVIINLGLTPKKNNFQYIYNLHNKTFKSFDDNIIGVLNKYLFDLKKNITTPNTDTILEFISFSESLFKNTLNTIISDYNNDVDEYLFRVHRFFNICKLVKNRYVIYFEAANFLSKPREIHKNKFTQKEKEATISFYLHYIYYNIKYEIKKLPKYNLNLLFENEEHKKNFANFSKNFSQLLIHKKINLFKKLLNDIPNLFLIKRKKINIENSTIKHTENKHSETLNLLNNFLNDEEPKIKINNIKKENVTGSEYINKKSVSYKINFSTVQLEILDLFCINEFKLTNIDLDNFTKKNKILKNQFIDSINEKAFEILDDNLIEFDDNLFYLNENYYNKIKCG